MTATTDTLKDQPRHPWGSADYGPIAVRDVLVSELLARAVDVHSGDQVLDVAAGSGNSALAAARRGGVVTATDIVPAMLQAASRRAEVEGLDLTVAPANAQDLPFDDGGFDVVLSSFGAMYAPDHQRAADELVRVCRPGGRIGLTNWSPDGLVARLQRVMAAHLPAPAGPRGAPPVKWGDEQYCRELFGSRVTEVSATVRADEWCAPSAAAQVELLIQHLPPWHAAYQKLPEEARPALTAAAVEEIERFNRATDGTLVATADYLEFVATVA